MVTENTGDRGCTAVVRIVGRRGGRRGGAVMMMMVMVGGGGILQMLVHIVRARGVVLRAGSGMVAVTRRRDGRGRGRVTVSTG